MKLNSNTVLITGGASGIGLALAKRFVAAGSKVIICGRRQDKLKEIKREVPQFEIKQCDLANEAGREDLAQWVTKEFPRLNVLVNNAGIQRRVQVTEKINWPAAREEIAINLEAPIHLTNLLLPHLLKQFEPYIVNVTSGLSFVPLANVPIYSATKAGFHSFTLSLRRQLKSSPIKVIEIIPPAVNTDLGGPGLHTFGADLNEFADSVFERLGKGEIEIPYGFSEKTSRASRQDLDMIFERMNENL